MGDPHGTIGFDTQMAYWCVKTQGRDGLLGGSGIIIVMKWIMKLIPDQHQ